MSQFNRPKISIVAHEAGSHTMRTRNLASILLRDYEVELITTVAPGQEPPEKYYSDLPLTIHSIPAQPYPHFFKMIRQIRKVISGDIIYAMKLRPTSYGIGLLEHLGRERRALVLDVDDWEKYMCYPYSKYWLKNIVKAFPQLRDPNSYIHTWLIEYFARFSNQITNVSHFFQRRYGGVLLPNGCDTERFNPICYQRDRLREAWGVANCKVIMFVGTADPYKGVGQITQAMQLLKRPDLKLVIVGRHNAFVDELTRQDNVLYWGMQPPHTTAQFWSMGDLVVLPQAKLPHSAGQMPMKMFEAMAMELPIISTPVSDINEVLQGCGRIATSDRPEDIADEIEWVLEHPAESRELGRAARLHCKQSYSWNAMGRVLNQVLTPYL